jgi:hypothetical protein
MIFTLPRGKIKPRTLVNNFSPWEVEISFRHTSEGDNDPFQIF